MATDDTSVMMKGRVPIESAAEQRGKRKAVNQSLIQCEDDNSQAARSARQANTLAIAAKFSKIADSTYYFQRLGRKNQQIVLQRTGWLARTCLRAKQTVRH